MASAAISRFHISPFHLLTSRCSPWRNRMAGSAADCFLLSLECGKNDRSRFPMASGANHATMRNRREQHYKPIGNKEYEWRYEQNEFWLARGLEELTGKQKLEMEKEKRTGKLSHSVSCLQTSKAHSKSRRVPKVQHLMSSPRPVQAHQSKTNLIWWDSPF